MNNNRQQYNKDIIKLLETYINKYPDIRFQQMLYNLNIIENNKDKFNEESKETFNKLNYYITIQYHDISQNNDMFNKTYKNIENCQLNNTINLINKKYTDNLLNNTLSKKCDVQRSKIIENLYSWLEELYNRYYSNKLYFRNFLISDEFINNFIITNIIKDDDTYYDYHINIINKLFKSYIHKTYNKELEFNFAIINTNNPYSYHGSFKYEAEYKLYLYITYPKYNSKTVEDFLENTSIKDIENIQKNIKTINSITNDIMKNELHELNLKYDQEVICKKG